MNPAFIAGTYAPKTAKQMRQRAGKGLFCGGLFRIEFKG